MEQLFTRNENDNNELVLNVFWGLAGLVLSIWFLVVIGVFDVDYNIVSTFAIVQIVLFMLPVILFKMITKYSDSFVIKYALIFDLIIITGVCYLFFTYQMVILFVFPVLLALLYMNKKLVIFAEIGTILSLIISHLVSVKFVAQPWLELFTNPIDVIRFNMLPRLMQLLACFTIINLLVNRLLKYFAQYKRIVDENTNSAVTQNGQLDTELAEFVTMLNSMTESEKNVFLQMLQGKTNTQIAKELSFSVGTVKNYISNIYDKLECKERNYLILKYGAILRKYDQSHKK